MRGISKLIEYIPEIFGNAVFLTVIPYPLCHPHLLYYPHPLRHPRESGDPVKILIIAAGFPLSRE